MDGYVIIEAIKTGILVMQFGVMPLAVLTIGLFISGLIDLKKSNH